MNKEKIKIYKIFEKENMNLKEMKMFLMLKISTLITSEEYDKTETYQEILMELEKKGF